VWSGTAQKEEQEVGATIAEDRDGDVEPDKLGLEILLICLLDPLDLHQVFGRVLQALTAAERFSRLLDSVRRVRRDLVNEPRDRYLHFVREDLA